jgi:hypothetical protein
MAAMKTLANPSDKDEILRRLQVIHPSTPRRWGKMTAHQMICHLSDAFRMFMGQNPVRPVPQPIPRSLLKYLALWAPVPWPKGFQAAPELDQQIGGTPPAVFDADMRELRELIDYFSATPRTFRWPQQHPHFGALSEKEWMRLGYLHPDHHLRQFGA